MLRVGIKLVVEVLDHYRGPDHKFRWLVAFAENARDKTRTGWPGRRLMAQRTRTSANRVSHVARDLIDDGVLQRAGGGGRGRGNAAYTLASLTAAQGVAPEHPMDTAQSGAGQHPINANRVLRDDAQGVAPEHPDDDEAVVFNPHTTLTPPGGAQPAPTAQTILSAFIDWDTANGGTLTKRTRGQLAKIIAALLAEGIDDRHIRQGLADWRTKEMHPAALDSFVNAAMNGRATTARHHRPSTGDRAIAEAAALKAQLRDRKELA